MKKRIKPLHVILGFATILAALVFILLGSLIILHSHPSIGAYGSDELRKIFGDQIVSSLETAMYQTEDTVNQFEYRLGLLRPANPFAAASSSAGNSSPLSNASQSTPLVPVPAGQGAANASVRTSPKVINGEKQQPLTSSPPTQWPLPHISPRGSQPDEGLWRPYVKDISGRIVAYRTFVVPDPQRPYVSVGIVAFDLKAVHLHYVIGFEEPYASKTLSKQIGSINYQDLKPNVLIAAFNGGFKFRHGNFGSMANGFISAPLRDGLSAIAIYKDGSVRIGEWGSDIRNSTDLIAVRQNGPLLIQNGNITQQVDSPKYWGYTLSGDTVTWRSGLAISQDGRTLFYFAGPSISAPILASAMMAVHPQSAMQLDINNYWVHFVTIHMVDGQLDSVPLFPKDMSDGKNRYLYPYSRDFFYVTSLAGN